MRLPGLRSSVLGLWLFLHVSVRAWMTYRSVNGVEQYAPEDRIIFEGTKWCGNGNIAEGPDDLGPLKETDACCRDHDMCPDIIEAGGSKHGLTNTAIYTRLNCSCDEKFYHCLQNASEFESGMVRWLYFTGLHTKCFRKDYPLVCKKRIWLVCMEYGLDTSQPMAYQWLDVSSQYAFPRMLIEGDRFT
ncbi:phospholipase A2 [Xylocopa sonorina]|uniref:phospholipase A2 n=1 Tax=Xylocopa sonorina TaxID=1818115 RepID=UPI00403AD127